MENSNKNNNQKKQPDKEKKFFPKMKKYQSITFWVVIILFLILFYQMNKNLSGKIQQISYTEFITMAANGEVLSAVFNGKDVNLTDINNTKYTTYLPFEDSDLVKELSASGVIVFSQKPSKVLGMIFSWLPFLIFIGFWLFMMKGIRGGGAGQAFSFGKSKARLSVGGKTKVTFKDVAGVDEAKEELEEIIEFLRAPEKFQRLGGRIPRGVLLLGRPGTGKTLLAKAVAGEANVPFYSISGSDFVEMFVGVGASRVRDMFVQAKKNAPCIAFIDEIDAVGRHRGSGLGGGHDEREQTLNQLLVEMDGFDPNDSVIIIAATNRPDVLDPALLRPGRFDRQVIVDLPDIKGREAILRVHSRKLPIAKEVKYSLIARGTPGFSGADLANLVNEAALMAARKNKKKIEMADFEEAKDKVTLGKERKSKVISEEDKKITAFHEIGHVLCSMFLEKVEPIHKVTIIPRGFTGGATHMLQTDRTYYTKSYLEESIIGLMGGRCAEEIVFNEISSGASHDIQNATAIAKDMVCKLGMSDKIGPMTVANKETQIFLGRDISQHETISEDTAKLIDAEIRSIITNAYKESKKILMARKELLYKLSEALLEKETLNSDELYKLTLENVKADDIEFIKIKFKKVQEMKIDINKPEKKKRTRKKKKPVENKTDSIQKKPESEKKVTINTDKKL